MINAAGAGSHFPVQPSTHLLGSGAFAQVRAGPDALHLLRLVDGEREARAAEAPAAAAALLAILGVVQDEDAALRLLVQLLVGLAKEEESGRCLEVSQLPAAVGGAIPALACRRGVSGGLVPALTCGEGARRGSPAPPAGGKEGSGIGP